MPTYPYTWLNLNDSAAGDLNASITASDVSFVLKTGQGAKFPTSDFIVRAENEIIHVATRTTDTCSGLTRGYDGTTAATHAANTVVFQAASKALFQRIYDNLDAHSHAQSEVTNLVADLAGKEPANANIQAHVVAAHAPSNAQANADITKAEIEAKLTGAISSHTHSYEASGAVAAHEAAADPHTGYQRESEKGAANGYASLDAGGKVPSAQLPASGGADPWTYVVLGSDFLTSSATAVNVTGLMFTPAANTRYEFKASLRTRTATTTVGPRPGLSWPTGYVDGVAFIRQSSGAGTIVMANGNVAAAMLVPVGGVPNTTQSHPAWIEGEIQMGASPSGNVQVQFASETAGTNVTIKAGSFLAYRVVS